MKEPPSRTFAHVLEDLQAVPSRFVACLEWQRLSNDRIRRDIHARRRHFFNKKTSLVNYLHPDTKPEEMLSDDSAAATVHELGQALTELEVHGHVFGACSLSVVLIDRDARRLDQSVAACIKAFATHDGAVFEETYNLLNAWLATMPGNARPQPPATRAAQHELRRSGVSLRAPRRRAHERASRRGLPGGVRDRAPDALSLESPLRRRRPRAGPRRHGQREVVSAELPPHARAAVRPRRRSSSTSGGSYENLTASARRHARGASGCATGTVSINPFSLPPTPEHLHFLHAFVRVLLQSGGPVPAHRAG